MAISRSRKSGTLATRGHRAWLAVRTTSRRRSSTSDTRSQSLSSATVNVTFGFRARQPANKLTSCVPIGGRRTPRRILPTSPAPLMLPELFRASNSPSTRRTCWSTARPPDVRRTPECPRSNSASPNSSSSRATWRLIVEVLMPAASAARAKLPAVAEAARYSRSRISTGPPRRLPVSLSRSGPESRAMIRQEDVVRTGFF